jgi:hypothetical protein
MSIKASLIKASVDAYSDKGYQQIEGELNAGNNTTRKSQNLLVESVELDLAVDQAGAARAIVNTNVVILAKVPVKAEVLWDQISIVSSTATTAFAGAIGFLDETDLTALEASKVTVANAVGYVNPITVASDISADGEISDTRFIAFVASANAATSGKVRIRIPFIALS